MNITAIFKNAYENTLKDLNERYKNCIGNNQACYNNIYRHTHPFDMRYLPFKCVEGGPYLHRSDGKQRLMCGTFKTEDNNFLHKLDNAITNAEYELGNYYVEYHKSKENCNIFYICPIYTIETPNDTRVWGNKAYRYYLFATRKFNWILLGLKNLLMMVWNNEKKIIAILSFILLCKTKIFGIFNQDKN